jgi:FlaA1/EpsC-like NDP-sugar epimerase
MKTRALYQILLDILLLCLSQVSSYLIRFEGNIPAYMMQVLALSIVPIVSVKIVVFHFFSLYRGMWRYTGITDLKNIILASLVSSVLIILAILFTFHFEGFSRSVYVMDMVMTIFLVGGSRLAIRLFYSSRYSIGGIVPRKGDWKKIIIIGAGNAGEQLLREIENDRGLNYRVIGFLDDDPNKGGKLIHGVPILGRVDEITQVINIEDIDRAVIAIPSATGGQIKRIIDICRNSGVRNQTIPGIGEMINDKVNLKTIRDISYNDILRRDPVNLDIDRIRNLISHKKIFVSGGGGSIGSELCRKLVGFSPEMLVIYERNEENLFEIDAEMRAMGSNVPVSTILGDILDEEKLESVLSRYRPQIIFHAAAYKHVPIVEHDPFEGIRNNVLGTKILADLSVKHRVEKFVLISTDKAVRPSSVMGATKKLAERYLQKYAHQDGCRFLAVRFGNVLGSSGSVVPIFIRQIEHGGPVTVTDPEVTRYFMTIPEAANLIIQAAAYGRGGEVYILDMGEPIRIVDLATDLIRLYRKTDGDIEITFTGLRPGEKLHEQLVNDHAGTVPTEHEKIFVEMSEGIEDESKIGKIEAFLNEFSGMQVRALKRRLAELIPDYTPMPDDDIPADAGRRSSKKKN